MTKWDRLSQRVFDRALDLAWDVLGPGPEVRFFVDSFFHRFSAQLFKFQNAHDAGELSDDALYDLVEALVIEADAFLPGFESRAKLEVENFHRRFTSRLVEALTGGDDEDPGPQQMAV